MYKYLLACVSGLSWTNRQWHLVGIRCLKCRESLSFMASLWIPLFKLTFSWRICRWLPYRKHLLNIIWKYSTHHWFWTFLISAIWQTEGKLEDWVYRPSEEFHQQHKRQKTWGESPKKVKCLQHSHFLYFEGVGERQSIGPLSMSLPH